MLDATILKKTMRTIIHEGKVYRILEVAQKDEVEQSDLVINQRGRIHF